MRTLHIVILASFLAGVLASCNPCDHLDCAIDDYYATLRIVDPSGDKDLAFGPDAIYDPAKIEFYTLNGSDTSFFESQLKKYPGTTFDSVLSVLLFPETTLPVYMKLNGSDTDTLAVSYNTKKSRCCGTITQMTNLRVNNTTDLPGGQGPQNIKK